MRTTYDVLPTLKDGIPTKQQISEAKKEFQKLKRKGRFDNSRTDHVTMDFTIDYSGRLVCYFTSPNEGKLCKHVFLHIQTF